MPLYSEWIEMMKDVDCWNCPCQQKIKTDVDGTFSLIWFVLKGELSLKRNWSGNCTRSRFSWRKTTYNFKQKTRAEFRYRKA